MKISFSRKKEIPQSTVHKVWKQQYPKKKMPKTRAFLLSDTEFEGTVNKTRKYYGDDDKKEYGRKMATKDVIAAHITVKEGLHLIVIRKGREPMLGALKHELKHIKER